MEYYVTKCTKPWNVADVFLYLMVIGNIYEFDQ